MSPLEQAQKAADMFDDDTIPDDVAKAAVAAANQALRAAWLSVEHPDPVDRRAGLLLGLDDKGMAMFAETRGEQRVLIVEPRKLTEATR